MTARFWVACAGQPRDWGLGIGDWGLGIGDRGLGMVDGRRGAPSFLGNL